MKRVNTRGIDLANKHVLMAALTYNLKKYLKCVTRKAISKAIAMKMEVKSVYRACFYTFRLYICSYFRLMEIAGKKTNTLLEK